MNAILKPRAYHDEDEVEHRREQITALVNDYADPIDLFDEADKRTRARFAEIMQGFSKLPDMTTAVILIKAWNQAEREGLTAVVEQKMLEEP